MGDFFARFGFGSLAMVFGVFFWGGGGVGRGRKDAEIYIRRGPLFLYIYIFSRGLFFLLVSEGNWYCY